MNHKIYLHAAVANAVVFIEDKEQHNKTGGNTMQEIDFYLVDAFSASSFGGNPAAVCPSTRGYRMRRYCGWHNSITSRKPRFVCTKGDRVALVHHANRG